MTTVIRLTEAMNSGSHGMKSCLGGGAAKTVMKRRMRPAAAVNGPKLGTVSKRPRWAWQHRLRCPGVDIPDKGIEVERVKHESTEDEDRERPTPIRPPSEQNGGSSYAARNNSPSTLATGKRMAVPVMLPQEMTLAAWRSPRLRGGRCPSEFVERAIVNNCFEKRRQPPAGGRGPRS